MSKQTYKIYDRGRHVITVVGDDETILAHLNYVEPGRFTTEVTVEPAEVAGAAIWTQLLVQELL